MDSPLYDLRHALRALRKRPGLSAVAVLTLALGIGATTAILSVVDTLMWRELPLLEPDRVMTVWQNNTREGKPQDDVAPANFLDWRERSRSFAVLAAAEPFGVDLTGDGPPEVLRANLVTEGFFEAVGASPYVGRTLRPDDYREGGQVVVLSHGLWQRRFGASAQVLGRAILLDGNPHVVVGVLAPDLELGLEQVDEDGVWLPQIVGAPDRAARGSAWWNVVGRLRPGVAPAQAQAELDGIAAELATEYPATNTGIGVTVVPLTEQLVRAARPALLLLLGAAGLVLCIACVNVANLLLARGADREVELAVRVALGARRRRLVGQLLGESASLALIGGVGGVLLAFWGVDAIKALAPGEIPRMAQVVLDLRVLAFAVGVTAATALAAGLVPALQASRPRLSDALKEGRTTAGPERRRLRGALIVVEMALAVMLLVGAGLLLRSFVALLRVDPGLTRENVVALQVFAWDRRPTERQRIEFFDQTLERIQAMAGVVAAGAVSAAPFLDADIAIQRTFAIEGAPAPRAGEEPKAYVTSATAGYFGAVGIPVLQGRVFSVADRLGGPPVAVVNETMARRYWPGEEPLGRRIRLNDSVAVEIVGVVGDVRHRGLDDEPRPEFFLPQAQTAFASMTYFVRTRSDPAGALEAVKQRIWSVDPLLTFYQAATVDALVSNTLAARRFSLVLLGIFAAIGLAMAAVGIYGVISYAVSRRTHEMAIRVALGADPATVMRLVVGQGLRLTGLGLAIGLGGALAMGGAVSTLLFGVAPRDGATLASAAIVLLAVALVACYLPARRATRVQPVTALRHE